MKKETKELVKRTLQMTDDKKLLAFAKSYAIKDEAFAEALIEKFLPKEDNVGYAKLVKDCFCHKKKGRAPSWGPCLDWTAIRKDSKKLMKQLEYVRKDGNALDAAFAALLFLETLAKEFDDDGLGYDYYFYEGKDFSEGTALDIVDSVLKDETILDKDGKHAVLNRLKELVHNRVLTDCLECDIEEVVDDARTELMDNDDLLREIDESIKKASSDNEKANYLVWKINLLIEMGRNEDAAELMDANIKYHAVSELKYDLLVEEGELDAAKAFCYSCVDNVHKQKLYGLEHEWREKILVICTQQKDVEGLKETYAWLFKEANVYPDQQLVYYKLLKGLYEQAEWPDVRDKLLKEKNFCNNNPKCEIYILEGMYEDLFTFISGMNSSCTGWYDYQSAGGELLEYYNRYRLKLSEEQCQTLETKIVEAISRDAQRVSDRKGYARIAHGLSLLSKVSESGKASAKSLTAKIIALNPKKPAYLSELKQYKELF